VLVKPSIKLQKIADTILKQAKHSHWEIDCIFYSPDDQTVRHKLRFFHHFDIKQQFHMSYMDSITLNVTEHIDKILLLLKYYQNLRCAIIMHRIDPYSTVRVQVPPLKFNFRAIISNAQDLLKKFSKSEILPNEKQGTIESQLSRTFNLEFQLFEENAYELRHKQFNGLLKNTTILNTIHYIANILGIKTVIAQPPDNTRVYSTLSLPPMLDITTAFDFLQDRYGIYSKGLVYYYINKILYIYPGYEINPKSDKVINIYNVAENTYLGTKGYHYLDEYGNVHILSNSKVESKNLSASGIENNGNYKVALRTDMTLDHVREVTGDKATFTKQNTLSCGLVSPRSMVADAKNAKYETSSNNAFQMASDMIKTDCIILATMWSFAEPHLIHPGQKIIYHYDDNEVYKVKTGVIEEITYRTTPINKEKDYIYICHATIALRLDPS
jgi:hypothetical protein